MSQRQTSGSDIVSEQALHWVMRVHSGECSDQERAALDEWLAKSEMHRHAYQEAHATWDNIEPFKSAITPELREARAYRHRNRPDYRLIAAAAIVLIVIAPLWLWWLNNRETTQSYSTVKRQQKHIQLADGTLIDMNTYTELKVHFSRRSRTIQLERGEALFTVAKNDARPFEVIAGGGHIRDIGTRFNVHNKDETIEVAVIEGAVAVTPAESPQPYSLTAGQKLSYNASGSVSAVEPIDIGSIAAWRDGLMIFRNNTLGEVAREISHYYDVSIQVNDPELKQLRISGTFRIDSLTSLLTALKATLPVETVMKGNGVIQMNRRDTYR
jgi:transmembrane sensor